MADGQIIIDINADPAEFRRALDRLRSETRSAAGSISSALERAGSSIQGIGDALTVGVTAPLAVGAGAAGKFSFEAVRSAEQVDIAFGTMLGPKRGKEMLEDLYDFAASTPFEVSGLSSATQKMLAYGFSAEDVIPLLTSVGDATAGLGAGQEGIDSVTRAMGQMQAKGKVMSEEMLQLTEVGIPAWQYLADAITDGDIPAAMEEVTYGFVDADTAIRALQEGMDRDFGGMMSKQAKTLTGILSNMSDAAYKAVIQAKDTEGYAELTDALAELSGEIGPFVESLLPILNDLLSGAAGVARGAAGAMEDFSMMSEEGRRTVVGLVAGAAGLGPTMSVAGRALQIAGSAAGGFSGGLGKVKSAAGKAKDGASALGKTVDDAALVFQIARANGDGLASSLSSAASQMGRTAQSTGVLSAGLKGLQAGLGGLMVAGVVAALAALAAELLHAHEMSNLMEESTIRLSDVTDEAAASMSQASDEVQTSWQERLRTLHADVDELVRAQADLARQSEETWSGALSDAAMADRYRDAILRLADQSNLTATEQAELKAAVEGFNEICGTSIGVIDPLNGKLSENADAINRVADSYAAQAKQAAAMEVMQGYYEQQIDLQMKMRDAEAAVEEARRKSNEALEAGNIAYQQYGDQQIAAQQDLDRLKQEYDACTDNIEYMTQVMVENGAQAGSTAEELSSYVETARGLGDALAEAGADTSGLMDALSQLGVSTSSLASLTDEQLMALAGSYDGTLSSVSAKLSEFGISAARSGAQAAQSWCSGLTSQAQQAVASAMQVTGMTLEQFHAAAAEAGATGSEAVISFAGNLAAGALQAQSSAQEVTGAVTSETSTLPSEMGADAAEGAAAASSAISAGAPAAGSAAGALTGAVTAETGRLPGETSSDAGDASSGFASGIGSAEPEARTSAAAMAGASNDMFKYCLEARDNGASMSHNFAVGIRSAVWEVRSAASYVAEAAASYLHHSVVERGPLRAGGKGEALWGAHAGENFAAGLASSAPSVAKAAAAAMSGAARIMGSAPALGWRIGPGNLPSPSAGAQAEAYVAMARSMDSLGRRIDDMAERLERALSTPSELTVNRREFGRLVREVS